MARRNFKSELLSLVFVLGTNPLIVADAFAKKILDDFHEALGNCRIKKERRFLIWGLLIGRSVDSFTNFFLFQKRASISGFGDTFNNRINRICRTRNPLTSDPTIITDLHIVKSMRNDFFHKSGEHFNDIQMRDFVFKSARCIQQLVSDL